MESAEIILDLCNLNTWTFLKKWNIQGILPCNTQGTVWFSPFLLSQDVYNTLTREVLQVYWPRGRVTSRFRRKLSDRKDSRFPICGGRWLISLQLTSCNINTMSLYRMGLCLWCFSVRTLGVMYDHTFLNLYIVRSDIRPHIKQAVSLVIWSI